MLTESNASFDLSAWIAALLVIHALFALLLVALFVRDALANRSSDSAAGEASANDTELLVNSGERESGEQSSSDDALQLQQSSGAI